MEFDQVERFLWTFKDGQKQEKRWELEVQRLFSLGADINKLSQRGVPGCIIRDSAYTRHTL